MYNPKAQQSLLRCLKVLPDSTDEVFRLRLISQFHDLFFLFETLYGQRDDAGIQLELLVKMLARQSKKRSAGLKKRDLERESKPDWFRSEKMAGMMLYVDRFHEDLDGVRRKISYFKELGINLIHLMPLFKSPDNHSDGGYAVSDYRKINSSLGSEKDLENLVEELHREDMMIMLDLVINHTSDEHEWARKARRRIKDYQDYYYTFPDRTVPDLFDRCLPEIFPENAPGNFTWVEEMRRYVMTVFHEYQWDLNYTNPRVFYEMLDILLHHANKGIDLFRLDAVVFLWKRLQTTSQNLPEAHLLIKLFKVCAKIVAPGVLFLAEAIVSPREIITYFGRSEVWSDECDIAYNASLMALMWDSLSTRDTRVLYNALSDLPVRPEGTTWINYLRCHDDIGLGYDNRHIEWAGYTPHLHRSFQVEFYTGVYPDSFARGLPFMVNPKTGDARLSGTLASLAGLEKALRSGEPVAIETSVNRILMLHALMIAYDGIPMLYYGDELGTTNDYSFMEDPLKREDNRWVHRPVFDWKKAQLRKKKGTIEYQIFNGIKHLLEVRASHSAFADEKQLVLQRTGNDHLLFFTRNRMLIVAGNFSEEKQICPVTMLHQNGLMPANCRDLLTGMPPEVSPEGLVLRPYQVMWLT